MKDIADIPISVAHAVTGALFGVAMMACAFHLYVQFRVSQRFDAEHWILFMAAATLVTCTGLYYNHMKYLYDGSRASLYSSQRTGSGETHRDAKVLRMGMAMLGLWWVSIFGVKLAYLLFFRKLVLRLQGLTRWWWCVMCFLVIAYVTMIVISVLACPYSDDAKLLMECSGPSMVNQAPRITISFSVLDVVSDVLIVSIPVLILWRARISLRQKIGLGITLCLSIVMAVIAFVRMSCLRLSNGALDLRCNVFWVQQECSIAVTMVSVIAFRSFFVVSQQSAPDHSSSGWRHYFSKIGFALKRTVGILHVRRDPARPSEHLSQSFEDLTGEMSIVIRSQNPKIPSGTITGIRSALDKAGNQEGEL